ncbi:MAG: thiamine phosphate synthase [Bacteroidia bacterium]|jgi:thiamine-phosphate pyrophosphorylase|nr:thiamine phosphate synthase [Bacteroidia bacterium]
MNLILITNPENISQEPQVVTALFEHGLERLHLRKPGMSTVEMRKYLDAIPKHFHKHIIIHSHHRLALSYGVGGIHLTRVHRRRKLSNWIRLRWIKSRRSQLIVTASYHKLNHIYTDKGRYNYVLLGPIFERQAGKFGNGFNAVSLQTALKKNAVKVVARGGVSPENMSQILQLGFAGMAFQHLIWKAADPVKEFLHLAELLRQCEAENQ